MAACQGTMNNFNFGNDRYQYYETICGGSGAGPWHHGTSAVHTNMTNTRLTDPEILEFRYPVVLEDFHVRRGSGGRRHCSSRRDPCISGNSARLRRRSSPACRSDPTRSGLGRGTFV